MTLRATLCAALLALAAPAQAETGGIVSIGGAITEIVYALGAGDRLVARDTTSVFPEAALALPDVGYMRALSPEGVLSVGPTLILADANAGPPETIAVLQQAAVPLVLIPESFSADGIRARILAVGEAIGETQKAKTLADQVTADLSSTADKAAQEPAKKRVLFILSAAGGRLMASGANTAADAMLTLAGAENAIQGFDGYKPVTDEAILAAAPDAILMMDRSGDHDSPVDQLVALPAIAATPAGESRAVIRMDGLYLLGFGPRTAQAVSDLNAALYGE